MSILSVIIGEGCISQWPQAVLLLV